MISLLVLFSASSLQYLLMSCLIITVLDGHLNDHIVWSQFITIVGSMIIWLLDHDDFVAIEMIKMKIFLFILNVHFNSSKEKIWQYDVPTEFSHLVSTSANFLNSDFKLISVFWKYSTYIYIVCKKKLNLNFVMKSSTCWSKSSNFLFSSLCLSTKKCTLLWTYTHFWNCFDHLICCHFPVRSPFTNYIEMSQLLSVREVKMITNTFCLMFTRD